MSNELRFSTVKQEAPSQRRHYRLTAPATVKIDKAEYRTRNWSLGGFATPVYDGAPAIGERIEIDFNLDFQGFTIAFAAHAEIVHFSETEIGAKFFDLNEREEALIKHFATSIISGEMAGVDGALVCLDRRVTPAPGILKPHTPEQKKKTRKWQKLISAGYITAGLLLAGFLLLTLANYLFRIDVQTAVVDSGIEQVVSRDVGHVAEVYVQEGATVAAGQPLLRVQDDQVAQWLAKAHEDAGTARTLLHNAEEKRDIAVKRFPLFQQISSDRLDSARAKVKTAVADRDEAKKEADRDKELLDEGVYAQRVYDVQAAVLAIKQGALDQAATALREAEKDQTATNAGLMFSVNYTLGDVSTLQTNVDSAAAQVQVAEAAYRQAVERSNQLVYRAPYAGTIVRSYKTPGMTVDRGEEIMILRHGSGERSIDAYLTQDEVVHVQAGTQGVAYVPGTNRRFKVVVTEVDRTRGFIKELETPRPLQPTYNWRGVEDKSAFVKLTFLSLSKEDRENLTGGMPVYVNLPKANYISFMSWFHIDDNGVEKKSQSTLPQASKLTEGQEKPNSSWFSLLVRQFQPTVKAATKNEAAMSTSLWPSNSLIQQSPNSMKAAKGFEDVRAQIFEEAQKALKQDPSPVETLHSSGVSDKNDPMFLASRKAFGDSDKFALLAVAYRISGNTAYLNGAKRYLLAWAALNKPTGEPIDETRLDGFLWGIDLVRSQLTGSENQQVNAWLERWLDAKHAFHSGSISATNNHNTHFLKIEIMLDKLLGRTQDYNRDLGLIQKQLDANLLSTGESIDYQQRDAMHYHVYDLEAWSEIALVTGCCGERIDRSFLFFENTLATNPNHIEFSNSTAPIDKKRAQAGFDYAQAKTYDVHDAARAIFSYATLSGHKVDDKLWREALDGVNRQNLFYLARFYLWPSN